MDIRGLSGLSFPERAGIMLIRTTVREDSSAHFFDSSSSLHLGETHSETLRSIAIWRKNRLL